MSGQCEHDPMPSCKISGPHPVDTCVLFQDFDPKAKPVIQVNRLPRAQREQEEK